MNFWKLLKIHCILYLLGETLGDAKVRDGGYLRGDSGDRCGGHGATQDVGHGGGTSRVCYVVRGAAV